METVNDITKKMRDLGATADGGIIAICAERLADRLDAAYRREMNALADANNIAMKTVAKECDMLRDAVSAACRMCQDNEDGNAVLSCNGDCANCPLRPGQKEVEDDKR